MKSLRSMALAAAFLLLAACGPAEPPALPANTLDRGLPSDPETLDFHKARSTQAAEVQRDLGEGLIGYSPAGELVPASAERWEVSEDGLTWTFHLRDQLRWSNGEAVTADHFVAGMRRLVNPATAAFYAQMLVDLENAAGIVSGEIPVSMLGVEAPDDKTLVMLIFVFTCVMVACRALNCPGDRHGFLLDWNLRLTASLISGGEPRRRSFLTLPHSGTNINGPG
jgi:oligopeptide transport system substrate-binding protein